jgi:hypothetical protein
MIVATGNEYIECAKCLAGSIKQHNTYNQVCLLTDVLIEDPLFDYVRIMQNPNANAFANDWQVFNTSPFRETIKLEADCLVTSNIDYYWDIFRKRDLVISTGCRDYYNNTSNSRHYRSIFDQNCLPDTYNAMVYWRLSNTAKEFFELVRNIFQNWEQFKTLIKFPETIPTTDVVYAMAATVIGKEKVTLTNSPSIVHMKKHIIKSQTNDWTRELVWERVPTGLKINTVHQQGVFHYYIKDWIKEYEQQ